MLHCLGKSRRIPLGSMDESYLEIHIMPKGSTLETKIQ